MLSSRRRTGYDRGLPRRVAERAHALNTASSEDWRSRFLQECQEFQNSDSAVDVPRGVLVETATVAPCRPEDDSASAFIWQAVLLDDTRSILIMQIEKKWQVGAMVAPHFLHVWLRLKRCETGSDTPPLSDA
jgi:hypothetical protein